MSSVSFNKLDIICLRAFWCFSKKLFSNFFPSSSRISRRGATVHFSCDEGYELQGSKSISCLRVTDSYVGWSDDRPICRGNDGLVIACPGVAMPAIFACHKRGDAVCWLSAGLSFCLNARSIFLSSAFHIKSLSAIFPWLAPTLTIGSHSFPSCCLAMPAWCWQLLKSDDFMTAGTGRLPLWCTWCSSVTVLMLQWLNYEENLIQDSFFWWYNCFNWWIELSDICDHWSATY